VYEIKIKRNGKTQRTVTGYRSQDAALAEGQAMADQLDLAPGTTLEVAKATSRKNPSKARKSSSRKTVRTYKDHKIRNKVDGPYRYVVEPYGRRFKTIKSAKSWIDGHVKRESRKNPPTKARKNPSKARKPLSKRLDLTAKRINWSAATKTEIRTIAKTAAKKGDHALAAKARAALKRGK